MNLVKRQLSWSLYLSLSGALLCQSNLFSTCGEEELFFKNSAASTMGLMGTEGFESIESESVILGPK